MELLKLLSASEIVAQIVSFLILLALLRIFAWKRILKILDERKARIASDLKMAEEARIKAAEIIAQYDAKMSGVDSDARKRIEEAIIEARKASEEIKKSAHQQAQGIIDEARQNIKFELLKAKEELKDEIVELTIKATENIIQEKFTDKDDRKLIGSFLEDVDKLK